MKHHLLLVVASVVLGTSWLPALVGSASSVNQATTAKVQVEPGDDTDPVAPVDPDDPNNPGTGSHGLLTLDYISNLTFKQRSIVNGQIIATATTPRPVVQISDRRAKGTGWNLLLKPEPLVGQTDHHAISAATLTLGAAQFAPSDTTGAVWYPHVVANSALPYNSYSLIAQAQNNPRKPQGVGTWLLRMNTSTTEPITLTILASAVTRQQNYQGSLSWLLTDTPQ